MHFVHRVLTSSLTQVQSQDSNLSLPDSKAGALPRHPLFPLNFPLKLPQGSRWRGREEQWEAFWSLAGLHEGALCLCWSRMVHPTLFFCLLVARLGPRACDLGAPDQENRPTSVTLLASSTSLNNPHFAFNLYRQMVATTPGRNIISPPPTPRASPSPQPAALQARPAVCTQGLEGLGFSLSRVPDKGLHGHDSQFLRALLPPPGACQPDVAACCLGTRSSTCTEVCW